MNGPNILICRMTKGGGAVSHSFRRNEKQTEADIAFEILKAKGGPLHYLDLTKEVLLRLGLSQEPVQIAGALTQINMDTRFSFLGQGEWGLRIWEPAQQPSKRQAPSMTAHKAAVPEEDKLELEELDDDLQDEELDDDLQEAEEALEETEEDQGEEKW